MVNRVPIFVYVSGTGNTLRSIISNCKIAEVQCVFSDNPKAGGLEIANNAKISTLPFPIKKEEDNFTAFDVMCLQFDEPAIIVLAGYMKILPPSFIEYVNNLNVKIINIHPSLLPKYKGLNTHQRVLNAKDDKHGFTVHHVTKDLDSGEIITQVGLSISDKDTSSTLSTRVKQLEQQYYPTIIDSLCKELYPS
jgi:phosphoribosylglycinamide formyltransferase-1